MMKTVPTIGLFLLISVSARAQTFQDFLDQVNAAPESLRTAIVDSFTTVNSDSPIIEFDSLAHYYYTGTASSVTVPGDANQWDVFAFPMSLISGTNFWYLTETFESDARLDYKFVLNGSTWILDPRNPNTVLGGFGPNSELAMPDFIQPPEIEFYPGIQHGTLHDTLFSSINLGNSRTIRVYTPPGYGSSLDSFAVVVVHDGLEYIDLAFADNVLDYLIDQGSIDPVIGVFVPPVDRTDEYAGHLQDEFTSFIVEELMPWVDSRWNTMRDPAKRATLGASNGGNIALWLAMNHPEVFGNVAAHSSNIQTSISEGFGNGPRLDLQLYLDLGTYDIPLLITLVRDFIPVLESRGYTYTYQEFHDGHSWGNWRGHIDDALEMFFPGPVLSVGQKDPAPEWFRLYQNYPNPFNNISNIEFHLPAARPNAAGARGLAGISQLVRLTVYDVLGKEVGRVVNERLGPGKYIRQWDAGGYPSGIYFYRLTLDNFTTTKKMILLK